MERQEGEANNLRCGRLSSLIEPSHRELRKIRIKMEWAICGCRKIKTWVVSPVRLARKNVGSFVEFGQPSPFLHLKKL
jgi:hypothetical protein